MFTSALTEVVTPADQVIGRGSGETIQIAFGGQGWALIQPSEGQVAAPSQSGGSGGGAGGALGKMLGG